MIVKQHDLSADVGAKALMIGITANTLLKLAIALIIGRGVFRFAAGIGLAGLALATVAGLFLF